MAADFDAWLAGIGAIEEDHVFIPIGAQSAALTALYEERATILDETEGGEVVPGERGVGESYSATLDDVDERIAAQLELDHPEAPRMRLRGLSDDDYTQVTREVDKWAQENPDRTPLEQVVEGNVRCIARAVKIPEDVTIDNIRTLRETLNRGEWARLLSHVTRLAQKDAEETSVPN